MTLGYQGLVIVVSLDKTDTDFMAKPNGSFWRHPVIYFQAEDVVIKREGAELMMLALLGVRLAWRHAYTVTIFGSYLILS